MDRRTLQAGSGDQIAKQWPAGAFQSWLLDLVTLRNSSWEAPFVEEYPRISDPDEARPTSDPR